MKEEWTGILVGRMHNAEVRQEDLAKKLGCTKAYVSMVLNGSANPKGGRERFEAAFEAILADRETKD